MSLNLRVVMMLMTQVILSARSQLMAHVYFFVFKLSFCNWKWSPEMSLSSSSVSWRLLMRLPNSPLPLSRYALPIASSLDLTQHVPLCPASLCPHNCRIQVHSCAFNVDNPGMHDPSACHCHCLKQLDVWYMDLEERQGFAQEESMALNMMEMAEWEDDTLKEVKEDFGLDNEWTVHHCCLVTIILQCCQ